MPSIQTLFHVTIVEKKKKCLDFPYFMLNDLVFLILSVGTDISQHVLRTSDHGEIRVYSSDARCIFPLT